MEQTNAFPPISNISSPGEPQASSSPVHTSTRKPHITNDNTPLRVLNLNCRSIKNKREELHIVIEDAKPDVIIGTESWLDSTIDSSEIFPDSYNVFRKDRGSNIQGGGVFVAIHNKFSSSPVEELNTDTEIIWAKITQKGKRDMYVGSCYRSDNTMFDQKEHIEQIKLSLSFLGRVNGIIIFAGDFNLPDVEWETCCVRPNSNKRQLHQLFVDIMQDSSLSQIVTEPTRENNILDLIFTRKGKQGVHSTSVRYERPRHGFCRV